MQPPVARARPVTSEHHGRRRTDDYEWLREKDDPSLGPEVLAYLEAENAYFDERTAHLANLRRTLFDEIRSRTVETDMTVPFRHRGFWWYSRSFAGRDHGAWCRVPVTDVDDWTPPLLGQDVPDDRPLLPEEEVLLDLDALAAGHGYFALGSSWLSLDGRHLAYSVDTTGDELFSVRVKDLASGELLEDEVAGTFGDVAWAVDGSFFYTTVNEAWRADTVWRHRLGTSQSEDELIYLERDDRFWVGVGRTRTDRFLIIASGSKTSSEYRFLDLEDPHARWQVFAERRAGLEYSLEHARLQAEDVFLVLHNATGDNFELGVVGCAPAAPESWQPLLAHDPEVRLVDVDAFRDHVVVHQRASGLPQLRSLQLEGRSVCADQVVGPRSDVCAIEAGPNHDFSSPVVRSGYNSLVCPVSLFDYDIRSRELTLLRQELVMPSLSGSVFEVTDYEEHRLWATAADGEKVPISLAVRRDARVDGQPLPLYLIGYGAYEASLDPWFSVARLSLLDRGAAFAIAHVRGGGEKGRGWYEGGRLLNKPQSFTDFIACAQHLVEEGWTRHDVLVAGGVSAGGLLIGAVANLAPSTFGAGLVAQVPFVDCLTTMLDATLPLTATEYEEWGNPEKDPAVYDLIASYAPYDNVSAVDYPPILAEASLHDMRVSYVEPAKWIARLRASAVGRRDFLLHTEMKAGHAGVSGRYQGWHAEARTMAWVIDRLGLAI